MKQGLPPLGVMGVDIISIFVAATYVFENFHTNLIRNAHISVITLITFHVFFGRISVIISILPSFS